MVATALAVVGSFAVHDVAAALRAGECEALRWRAEDRPPCCDAATTPTVMDEHAHHCPRFGAVDKWSFGSAPLATGAVPVAPLALLPRSVLAPPPNRAVRAMQLRARAPPDLPSPTATVVLRR
ncbi:MAG: hypothetical protein AAGH15_26220 [Myxococcota bacterium]